MFAQANILSRKFPSPKPPSPIYITSTLNAEFSVKTPNVGALFPLTAIVLGASLQSNDASELHCTYFATMLGVPNQSVLAVTVKVFACAMNTDKRSTGESVVGVAS